MSISKMSRSANHPVAVGSIPPTRSRRQKRNASPADPSRYFRTPATRKSHPSARTSTGSEPTVWYASTSTSVPRSCASLVTASTSSREPFRKQTCVTATSAVRSSIAASNRSSGIVPSASAGTCSTRNRSCACQICPIVGNSKSLITTLSRPSSNRSPDASALTPAETDVVTAISSSSAPTSPAIEERTASSRPTQYSQGAPCSSQSSR